MGQAVGGWVVSKKCKGLANELARNTKD